MNDIKNIEKIYFSNLQSSFDKLLNKLENNNLTKNNNILIKIIELNKKIDNLEVFIQDINKDIITNNNIVSEESKIFLENYNNNNKTIDKFLPYMMAYNLYLENKNI